MEQQGATVRRISKSDALFGLSLAAAAAGVLVAAFIASPAQARHRGHHIAHHGSKHHARETRATREVRHSLSIRHQRAWSVAGGPAFAAIVVDGNNGQTLYGRNEDELRHPASITKVMTLYLLFEQLEQGRLRLDSQLRVSAHAAVQKPTKLGLRPGATISVEDAIKAVVTRSANDIAVAIAEAIGGDEDRFAEMMTRKAHELGMSRTRYVNASGLPDDAQITTARDLSLLGRAVQERFPRYYRYFATRAFYYAGATIANHNHLMSRVEGMDGIKTGYTRASGFNLLTSVKRDDRYLVAVVMGGASASSRDRIMAGLIDGEISHGSTIRTASVIPDLPLRPIDRDAPQPDLATLRAPIAQAAQPANHKEIETRSRAGAETDAPAAGASKLALSAIAPKAAQPLDPIRVASIDADVPLERPRPAYVSGAVRPQPEDEVRAGGKQASTKAAADGSTIRAAYFAPPTATPSTMRWVTGPGPAKDRKFEQPAEKTASVENTPQKGAPGKTKTAQAKPDVASDRPAAARSGWMIQIGATDDAAKANALLARAKADGRRALGSAQPFTEKVQKGSATLYRARFAGLEQDSAELACKTLQRSGFSCFATKN